MVKVITYGTYDLLHYGHIRLLQRAKALGDYLIVGVTSDDFDRRRGKINVQQSLMERVEAVRATGIADEIIIEEYEGQKIDDIRKYHVDIFTVGSDWKGYFDYLKEYCKVVYLERTQGISSSELRAERRLVRLGLAGGSAKSVFVKYCRESFFVNGLELAGIYSENGTDVSEADAEIPRYALFGELLRSVDAVYLVTHPSSHYALAKEALLAGKHVLCESPVALSKEECAELEKIAAERQLVFMEAIKTACATAFDRLLLLAKSGRIGKIVSVDAVCTSLHQKKRSAEELGRTWNSICAWGPTAMLPVFQLLGTDYASKRIISLMENEELCFDAFTAIQFIYPDAAASIRVGTGVKSEGELVVSGTKGYIYVPAPWWKTDYFELRFENPADNRRYFYQLDGEGIRNELAAFVRSIASGGTTGGMIPASVTEAIASVIGDFYAGRDVVKLTQ